jgi:hypothetical protein
MPETTLTKYFPAQEIHFGVDKSQAAGLVWVNDPRLGKEGLREHC